MTPKKSPTIETISLLCSNETPLMIARLTLPRAHLLVAALVWLCTGPLFAGRAARGQEGGLPRPSLGAALYEQVKHDRARLKPFLKSMPKGGVLHAHLSGELDPDFLMDLAARQGYSVRIGEDALGQIGVVRDVALKLVSPASVQRVAAENRHLLAPLAKWLETAKNRALLRAALTLQPGESSAEFFGPIFDRVDEPGKDPQLARELFQNVIERAHEQAINYLELRVNPRLATDPQLMASYGKAAAESLARWPEAEAVDVRFVVGVHRGGPRTVADLEASYQAAAADDSSGDLVVGVDLVGAEDAAGAPAQYLSTLRALRARYPSVHLTLHAGESTQSDSHVRDSILLGAERIGHGTNLNFDALNTLRLARDNRVLVEVSLISNLRLLHIPIEDNDFWTFLTCGLPVSLNTDDGAIFDSTLTDEFTEAVLAFDLTWPQLRALAKDSLEFSFAPQELKRSLLSRWEKRWTKFEQNPAGP
jgi:adenosine deaminase CECR1